LRTDFRRHDESGHRVGSGRCRVHDLDLHEFLHGRQERVEAEQHHCDQCQRQRERDQARQRLPRRSLRFAQGPVPELIHQRALDGRFVVRGLRHIALSWNPLEGKRLG
jgi:hypothetical protein